MAGDLGKLKEICELKKKFSFRLFVDDAHGIGTMGENGRGTGEHFGVQDEIDIYFGTFAKKFSSIGAFISSTKTVIDFFKIHNTITDIRKIPPYTNSNWSIKKIRYDTK